jgi:hypothetical protein
MEYTFDCNPEESSCLLLLWKTELVVVITEWVVSMARFFQVSSLGYEQAGRIARTLSSLSNHEEHFGVQYG